MQQCSNPLAHPFFPAPHLFTLLKHKGFQSFNFHINTAILNQRHQAKSSHTCLCCFMSSTWPNYIKTVDYHMYINICLFQSHVHEYVNAPQPPLLLSATLLGRLSTRFLSMAVRIYAHSATRALMGSGTDVK